jgi:hypothetical protein
MKKNMLKEQYARLFKGRPSSNDAKLIKEDVDPEEYIDVNKMRQINDVDKRGEINMYEDGEEIKVPLKKPIDGKREFIATVYADDGYTSFTFEEEVEEAFESVGIDTLNDLGDFMEDSMF